MSDLVSLQAELAALKKALRTGVLTVEHDGTRTTYRSLAEIEKIIAKIEQEIAGLSGAPRRRVRRAWQSGKGY